VLIRGFEGPFFLGHQVIFKGTPPSKYDGMPMGLMRTCGNGVEPDADEDGPRTEGGPEGGVGAMPEGGVPARGTARVI